MCIHRCCMYTYKDHFMNVLVDKREALNSLQKELENTQDHLNLAKQVRLKV